MADTHTHTLLSYMHRHTHKTKEQCVACTLNESTVKLDRFLREPQKWGERKG